MKNEFLTNIAKEYNEKILSVAFVNLSDEHCFGHAHRSVHSTEEYWICIDKSRLICPSQVFFVLYHEIAHIVNFHLGYLYCRNSSTEKENKEKQADIWAFKEMGIMDAQGIINPENIVCYKCICEMKNIGAIQNVCPKGLRL
jgi:hypothetical protein